MTADWQEIVVEVAKRTETPCDCCGTTTVELEGDLIGPKGWMAFYHVSYSDGHPENGLIFRVWLGDWSEGAGSETRWLFGAQYSAAHRAFMLSDHADETAKGVLTGLDRTDILNSPFAQEAFAMLDAIFMKDPRLEAWKR